MKHTATKLSRDNREAQTAPSHPIAGPRYRNRHEQLCLAGMLSRGEAWTCECGAICGCHIDRCWSCGRKMC